jgi:ABC-type sugar transport system ATPase subunit
MAETQTIINMKGIDKAFPGVIALEDVDFSLNKGEIHALMGENGAGKSTLIKILTGVEHPDKGTIELEGTSFKYVLRSILRNSASAQSIKKSICARTCRLPRISCSDTNRAVLGAFIGEK